MPQVPTRARRVLARTKTRVTRSARHALETVPSRLGGWTYRRATTVLDEGREHGDKPLRAAGAAATRGDRRRTRKSLRRSLLALRADDVAALAATLDEAELWGEFARVARRADIDDEARTALIESAIARGRPEVVRALHRSADEPPLSAFRLGRAYEQAGRWGSAAAAYRRSSGLKSVAKAARNARFYLMVAKRRTGASSRSPTDRRGSSRGDLSRPEPESSRR